MSALQTLLTTEHLRQRFESWHLDDSIDEATLIVFFGQWNAGKSSLINALLGTDELLPTGPIPETGLPVVIAFGDERSVSMEVGSVQHPIFNRREMKKAIQRGGRHRVVRLSTPSMPWRDTVLVDLPGVNSVADAHNIIATDFLPRADAVVYTMRADQAPQAVDLQALGAIITRLPPAQVHVVVTHAAALDRADHYKLTAHIRALVPANLGSIHLVDSLEHFEQSSGDKGIHSLHSRLAALVQQGAVLRSTRRARRRIDLARDELQLCEVAIASLEAMAVSSALELRNRRARADAAKASLGTFLQTIRLQLRSIGAEGADALSRHIEQLRQNAIVEWRGTKSRKPDGMEKLLGKFATKLAAAYKKALQQGRAKLLESLQVSLSKVPSPEFEMNFSKPEVDEPFRVEDLLGWIPTERGGAAENAPGGEQEDILKQLKGKKNAVVGNPWVQLLKFLVDLRNKRLVAEQLTQYLVDATLKSNAELITTFRAWWGTWSETLLQELSTTLAAPLVEEIRTLERAEPPGGEAVSDAALNTKKEQRDRLRAWLNTSDHM